jgi:Fe2+ or Zn2+ uptake regulation protein
LEGKLDNKREQICRMILHYLRKNPDAEDTLEGIAKWWLEVEKIESSVDDVANALESLMEQGVITINKTKGGTTFYKINKEP